MKETLRDVGLLLLRVGVSALMITGHGWGKFMAFGEKAATFPDPLGLGSSHLSMALATGAEFGCALLVLIGLFTRVAVLPLVVTMLTAAFVIHADDPWSKKEFALLYLVPFLSLAFTGAGRFSLDGLIDAKKKRGWQ